MPMVPSTVRAGLVTRINTISGLPALDYIPEVVIPPMAFVGQLEIDFDSANARGLDMAHVDVVVIVQRMDAQSAQTSLDGYLAGTGASSIKAAIEADKTLAGACSTLRVLSANPGTFVSQGIDFLAYRYRVVIYG